MLVPLALAPLAVCVLVAGCDAVFKPPRERKLADLKAKRVNFALRCPRGESFQLLLGVPEPRVDWTQPNAKVPQAPPFQGRVSITQNGGQVCTFPISSAKVSRSNWLQQHGLEGGYILQAGAVPKEYFHRPLDAYLRGGQTYDVAIVFTQPPPTNTSLWMTWLGRK